MIVTLAPLHVDFADAVARQRRADAVRKGRPSWNGAPIENAAALALDTLGARCECAAYLALKPCRWNHLAADSLADLADLDDWVDVKGRARAWYDLPVQKEGRADWAYLLVTANHPDYRLVGWIMGRDAMRPEHWSDPAGGRPAYFVRQDKLRQVEELRALMALRRSLN